MQKISGERVRAARVRAKLSLRELASRSGLGKSTLARIEDGSAPRWDTVQRLAAALDVEPEHLCERGRR